VELVSMTCSKCGGKLQISKDADQFLCLYCGAEYLVSFSEGGVSIKLLTEGLIKVQTSTEKAASELALVRIKDEKVHILKRIKLLEANLITREGKSIYKNLNWNDLDEFKSICVKEIEKEKKQTPYHQSPYWISDLEQLINAFPLLKQFREILIEEQKHMDIVKG